MSEKRPLRSLSPAKIDALAADWVVRHEAGLSDPEKLEFARWQKDDPRHADAIVRHEQAWSLLDRPRAGGRTPELLRALPARVAQRRRGRGAAVMAAALVFAAGTSVWRLALERLELSQPGSAQVLMPRKQMLPDGSAVELKGESRINVAYTEATRRITLVGGEALFHVAKEATRPFVVVAAGVEVRAVGTVFLVQLAAAQVDVIVTEGRVSVATKQERFTASGAQRLPGPEASTMVGAGTRLTIDASAGRTAALPVAISASEISTLLSWRAPFLEFTDVPLTAAVAMLNRHSPIPLVVEDPALAALAVNGRFRADNSETLARLLESSFGLTADHRGDRIVLRMALTPAREK